MTVFISAAIGYVAGTFPSAWLVATARGQRYVLDGVRRDVGEADAHFLLSKVRGRSAAFAAALDVVKGLLPVIAMIRLAGPYEVAACAVGAVAGHCWPFYFFRFGGRGLAAASGAFLAFVPVEMAIAGIVRVAGGRLRVGGLASTIGFAAIPFIAWWRGQPVPYLVASGAINVLIFLRRLEGLSSDVALGRPRAQAAVRRVVLDASETAPA